MSQKPCLSRARSVVFSAVVWLVLAVSLVAQTSQYLFIGHPRDDGPQEIVQRDVERIDYSVYDLLLLGGDYTWNGTGTRATVAYLDAVFDLAVPTTLAAIGNHDDGNKSFFTDVTGRPAYYTYKKDGVVFAVLDTTDDGRDILGAELQMLQDAVDALTDETHLVLVHHHIIWMADYGPLAHLQGSASIGASSNTLSGLNFHSTVYPILLQAKAKGVEVMCLAGDRTGTDTEEFYIDHTTTDGVRFIAAGFKEELTPSLRTAVVLSHDVAAGTLTPSFPHLTELPRIPDEPLVINELHYDPAPGQGNDWSFVELYNRGSAPYDLSGARFSSGIGFSFPDPTIVAPGGYVVIAADAANYAGLSGAVFDFAGVEKPDSDDPMTLRDRDGLEIDDVAYGVSAPWPTYPDNLGPSLMLIDPGSDNNLAASWGVSERVGGTPGELNTPPSSNGDSLRINEFLAANDHIAPDNVDFDDYSDWIELYNPNPYGISLYGYFLTDDTSQPLRWPFPAGSIIPAEGYLVVRADGFDAGPGETFERQYSPWSSFQTRRLHTNFKLSRTGEQVGLYRLKSPPANVTFLPLGAEWRYFDHGTLPAADWNALSYDDTAWAAGEAQLGYGDGDEMTVVGYGPDSNDKYAATYFRAAFDVVDPGLVLGMNCRALIDDGAVIYLNGTEIARIRINAGVVDETTYAEDLGAEGEYDDVAIPTNLLVAGSNVIAVEVHQRSGTSSDISFDLELTGVEGGGASVEVDSVTFGQQVEDVSYGRNPADDDNWWFFGEPTPGAANDTTPTMDRTPSTAVDVSVPSGFYTSAQSVAMSTSAGGATIRYTLDGSVPSSSSPAYTTPIDVTATTILRARTFEADRIPGPLATRSYLLHEPASTIPVVSLVAAPDTLFDPVIGIYDNDAVDSDDGRVHKGREVPSHIEFFLPDGTLGFKVSAGTRIGGENIWRFDQKPLNISMRGKYGDDLLSYKLFSDEKWGTFDGFKFRNGGDEWDNCMLRDAMSAQLAHGQLLNDSAAYRPCNLYLNGVYQGIHNIRERLGDRYFFNAYQLQPDEYDQIEYKNTATGRRFVAEAGDLDHYTAFERLVRNNDLSVAANYEAVDAVMNVDSFIDWVALIDFGQNTSWVHNQVLWRSRKADGEWRWIINDIDRAFKSENVNSSLIDNMKSDHRLLDDLLDNPGFANRMVQRYAAHLGSTFHPDRIADIIDGLADETDPEIQRHIDRWLASGGISSLAFRQAEFDEIKQFAVDRTLVSYDKINQYVLGAASGTTPDLADLTIDVSPAGAGTVLVSGVPVLQDYSNVATMFRDKEFDLAAQPAPGFEFAGWSTGEGSPEFSLILTGDAAITANFVPSGESMAPALVDANLTLTAANSPYALGGDLVVDAGVTLTVEAGVTILMPECASIYVHGALQVNGTEASPVEIRARQGAGHWGAIAFVNASGPSTLAHVVIRDASFALEDPVELKAAVSNFHSDLTIEDSDIEAPFPVFCRGGSTIMRRTYIHPTFTSDGINIKDGDGLVEDCTFIGNESPDTDAIDFDNVTDGTIRRNRIYAFRGSNSDGIDVGEGCVNLQITENRIYNCSDKGVSVGQGSVTVMSRNLIVGCELGVGIKDTGSTAIIDQCTLAQNAVGVAVYEKNFGSGGGNSIVTNTIFSRSKDDDFTVDVLSAGTVAWSMSDTIAIPGSNNFVDDPLFTDAGIYDFSLTPESPAMDAGDPAHALDGDGSIADLGAYYVYDADDYPFQVPNSVVINEILAHSGGGAPDWIELYNASSAAVDVSGWFLSDSGSDLERYRIADGTVIGAGGYLVFDEDQHFGASSTDAGRLTPFALSENGETVHLYGPSDGLLLPYREKESFGPSATGVTKGRYFKASTSTFNFVAMAFPTPGGANSLPLVGPVVISEIMYNPDEGDAEFVELLNISNAPVTLHDALKGEGWSITQGFTYDFPPASPVTMQPGERIVLVQDVSLFLGAFTVPAGTQVIEWSAGALSNGGEKIELSRPGDLDDLGERQFIRIDRVDYEDSSPWPFEPDLGLLSLTRVDDTGYGNDPANWIAAVPTPGGCAFDLWAAAIGLSAGANTWDDDPDGDGRSNLYEYGTGTHPLVHDAPEPSPFSIVGGLVQLSYTIAADRPELSFAIQRSPDLSPTSWVDLPVSFSPPGGAMQDIMATESVQGSEMFYRLVIRP